MNDSKEQRAGEIAFYVVNNLLMTAEKLGRTIAMCRCLVPNEAEADFIENEVLRLFDDMVKDQIVATLPKIRADLAIAKAKHESQEGMK